MIALATLVDRYSEGAEVIVMTEQGLVVALSAVGSAVVQVLSLRPHELPDLAAAVADRVGAPPAGVSAESLVGQAVVELEAAGIVDTER